MLCAETSWSQYFKQQLKKEIVKLKWMKIAALKEEINWIQCSRKGSKMLNLGQAWTAKGQGWKLKILYSIAQTTTLTAQWKATWSDISLSFSSNIKQTHCGHFINFAQLWITDLNTVLHWPNICAESWQYLAIKNRYLLPKSNIKSEK